jgi:uncharacterized protein (TIGR04255 family)
MAYKRAPVTEAVIELRFARQFDPSLVSDAARRMKDEYIFEDIDDGVNIRYEVGAPQAELQTAWQGRKLSSIDRTDSLIFRTNAFVCSRLAPYTGWESFYERAVRGWQIWRKLAGPIELSRLGVRYVNRIDIPNAGGVPINIEEYLNISPRSPEFDAPMSSYAIQVVRPLHSDDCMLVLNSSTLIPPLIGFAALALDIDVFRETALPRRDEDLWALVSRIRAYKNSVFETCITDRSRALFD